MTDVTSHKKMFSSLLSEDFFNWWSFKDITDNSDFNYAYDYTIFFYNEFLTEIVLILCDSCRTQLYFHVNFFRSA